MNNKDNKNIRNSSSKKRVHRRLVFNGCNEPFPLLLRLPLFYFSETVIGLFYYLSMIISNFLKSMFTMLANRPLLSKSCRDVTYGLKKQGENTTDIL